MIVLKAWNEPSSHIIRIAIREPETAEAERLSPKVFSNLREGQRMILSTIRMMLL